MNRNARFRVWIGVAFDPQSAPKVDPVRGVVSFETHREIFNFSGVNVGRRKGSIFGAATQLVKALPFFMGAEKRYPIPDVIDYRHILEEFVAISRNDPCLRLDVLAGDAERILVRWEASERREMADVDVAALAAFGI